MDEGGSLIEWDTNGCGGDDDGEFAFVDDLAIIGGWSSDNRVRRGGRRRCLQKVERLIRFPDVQLCGKGMKIIPQRDDLGWLARSQEFHIAQSEQPPISPA